MLSIAVLLAMLTGYNVALSRAAKSSQRHRLLTRLHHLPGDTDCLFLGNSLVEAGCEPETFRTVWRGSKPVNIALGATSPVEHYLILKEALRQPIRPRYIIYGFFDDQLFEAAHGDWSELIGNRAISYAFPSEAAAFYAPGSYLKELQLWVTGQIPMLAERSSPWARVELLRRSVGDLGLPKHAVNRFGRVEDFGSLEAKDTGSFNRRCEATLQGKLEFSAPVRAILRLAHEHGAGLVLLQMPMPSRHRALFYSTDAWKQLEGGIETLARKEGGIYLRASDWVSDDANFEDATHLSEAGARELSRRLALVVRQMSLPISLHSASVK